jgi:hypothetical protein
LEGQGEFRHLVEKQRTVSRSDEGTGVTSVGTGERASDMAKQFALGEPLGNCSAVERHERLVWGMAHEMQESGRKFLAGPRFAEDEHWLSQGRQPVKDRTHLAKRSRFPSHGVGDTYGSISQIPAHDNPLTANGNGVAEGEPRMLDPNAIDPGPRGATEVRDAEAL